MLVDENGWKEWSKYVLKELERLNACYETLRKDINDKHDKIQTDIKDISNDITALKIRAGFW